MTTPATRAAATAQAPPATHPATYGPDRSATTAIVAAATPTPAGWAIWRMPMANPRRPAGNQPTTTRPLATLLLAAARPARPSAAASVTGDPDSDATPPKNAAPTSPSSSTSRSPRRSVTNPHGISATHTPAIGAAATSPASARLSPRACRLGIRNAGPCTITALAAWAAVLAPSIAQRRRTPISPAWARVLTPRLNVGGGGATGVSRLSVCEVPDRRRPAVITGNSPFGRLLWCSNTAEADRTVSYLQFPA